jgi:hypothetical protein
MGLIMLATEEGRYSLRLTRIVADTFPNVPLELFTKAESLAQRLRVPPILDQVVLIMAETPAELNEVWEFREMLWNLNTVLVLGAACGEDIHLGHDLRPRLLTDISRDFYDVQLMVLALLQRTGINPQQGEN